MRGDGGGEIVTRSDLSRDTTFVHGNNDSNNNGKDGCEKACCKFVYEPI